MPASWFTCRRTGSSRSTRRACRIWELAGDGRTLLEIKERLQREFDVEPERLETELLALVAELSREGMLDDDNAE